MLWGDIMAMNKDTTKRYSLYLNLEYAELIESMAKENGVSVNGMMNILIRSAIDNRRNMDTMTSFMGKFVQLIENGDVKLIK